MKLTITWRYIVGIDISKKWLDIYLFDRKTKLGFENQLPNSRKGYQQLARWLESNGADKPQTKLISEHTGRYGEHLLRWTTQQRWPHAVVKTTALRKINPEHHRKTDSFDANQLAEYGHRFEDRLRLVEAPKPAVGQLKRLQPERRKMVDQRAALKAKLTEADLHDANMERLIAMWEQQVQLLSEHINELEARIRKLTKQSATLNPLYKIMRTAPGMGKVLTPLWLSLFTGRKVLNPRKVSSCFGFAPHPRRSGSSVRSRGRSAGFGNAEVRKVLHQAALSVATHYPHYRAYYEQKEAEGKEHLLIINNIINKLIRLYCAMWNSRSKYDPNYIQKMNQQWKKSA